MVWKKIAAIFVSTLLTFVSACNLPHPVAVSGENPHPPTATVDVQTQVAGTVAASTPAVTPTITFTITPIAPMVSVSLQTNCRTGPGTAYDILGIMDVGQIAEVIGRSAAGDNWIIRLPSNPAIVCWLWGYYASVSGDTSGLTVYATPPTPTPATAFTFSYHFWGVGPGYQCLLFDVTNTGSVTWESYTLSLHDTTHGDTGSGSGNEFISYDNWCGPTVTLLDLTPGETGTASAIMHMVHDPHGDHFEATLTLCSQNGLTGNCLTKSITFNF